MIVKFALCLLYTNHSNQALCLNELIFFFFANHMKYIYFHHFLNEESTVLIGKRIHASSYHS